MEMLERRKPYVLVIVLILITLSCSTLTGNSPAVNYGADVPPPPPPPPGYVEDNNQPLASEGQSLFLPVMVDVLIETAHTFGYPTPYDDPNQIIGAGNLVQPCYHDEGCITRVLGEMIYNDGTVGPAYYRYSYRLPLSEVGVACDQEISITVNQLSDTYLSTLAYENWWDAHRSYSLDDGNYSYQVYELFYDSGFEVGLGYAWVYQDILVDFMVTGSTMAQNCYGPGIEMSADYLSIFYEIMRSKGLTE